MADMKAVVAPLTGPEFTEALGDLARLRIIVFRDFPYLYDGSLDYEQGYLQAFAAGKDAIIVAARDGERIVGVATGSALATQQDALRQPFEQAGYNVDSVFYCGESVLLPEYRGQGIGHAFFDHRETHAKARGYKISAFCSVVRPPDHPMRPMNYQPLDAFWAKRGYRKAEGLLGSFNWKDVGQDEETDKPMQFWLKDLT